MQKRKIIRYTESFKKKVLDELEQTNSSYAKIAEKYNIRGSMTIKRWILASGRKNLLLSELVVDDEVF